jgi:hypothetical protein
MVRIKGRLALVSVGVLVLATACGPSDVEREPYVSRNLELLAAFPTPTGSQASSTVSRPWTLSKHVFGSSSYIAGYRTFTTFRTPAGTKASDLAEFYSGDLEGWRRANWGRSFASSERSVCYRGSLASICVDG